MYRALRPLLFALDPARAHALAMGALSPVEHVGPVRAVLARSLGKSDPRLEVRVMGLTFPSPVGLAGGFDKNAERPRALAALGFGHLELGTVTAEAQEPNPPPNLFRLSADAALVNRLGFPNQGARRVAERIGLRRAGVPVPIGVSIGKSRRVPLEPLEGVLSDYLSSFRAVRGVADFVVVNVSSPNTKNLRAMQAAEGARALFAALVRERGEATVPILVKIAPDLDDDAISAVCDEAMRAGLAGVVATNTTTSRAHLATPPAVVEAIGEGGLSGKPLFARAVTVVSRVRARVGASACVIGVGGVDDVETTLAMLRAGADLVQLYTGFVYRGPLLARTIARGLLARMEAEGASSLAELAGGGAVVPPQTNGVTVSS
jgi:dihydroorotate dehydrogenase